MPSQITVPINGAPNKWDLMLSLFETTPTTREVTFALSQTSEGEEVGLFFLRVQVTDVSREDNEGTVFGFQGDCTYGNKDAKASGRYSIATRKGIVTIDY